MAVSKAAIALLLFSILVLKVAETEQTLGSTDATKIDCGAACAARCRLSSRPRLCKRACGTCCGKCNCVPPGTSGNQEVCPCYANMTTHGNKHKCP
ncbi:snakin-2-like [Telopea speciosissima]|uniref:snakin-2-like n=1 Tax=Telopea speciosissima TaxID=54955 RepID=UPI001CC4C353|nr:snakin-2-like [Telopea speciosissima]